MKFGSLFTGIGGFDLGLERAGMACSWQVEIEPFCLDRLSKHWPTVPKFTDVRGVGVSNLSQVDLICGGFPCQDISNAGRRKGLDGEKSGLWREFQRIVVELKPRWVVIENSAHGRKHWLCAVRRDLRDAGYQTLPVEISAAQVGANHERRRCFVLAHAGCGRCALEAEALQAGGASPESDRWWAAEPGVRRVDDGVPHRVDRLRALGNAVVPQEAEWLGHLIMRHES